MHADTGYRTRPSGYSSVERAADTAGPLQDLSPEAGLEYGHQRDPNWPEAELPAWVESKVQLGDQFMSSPRDTDDLPWTSIVARINCQCCLSSATRTWGPSSPLRWPSRRASSPPTW